MNRSSCWSIAVLKNIAKIVGAGPLMVHGNARHLAEEIESRVQLFHVVERRDGDAPFTDLPEDVRPLVRILPVEGHAIECRPTTASRCRYARGSGTARWCDAVRLRRQTAAAASLRSA